MILLNRGQKFNKMKNNNHKNKPEFDKPEVKVLGNALDIIKNEFRPGTGDSIPAVENINTDG